MRKISERKRIVVKVGTSTLTHHRTGRLNIRRVERLAKTLADIYNAGHEVILVSSGAIGLGMGKLGLTERPKDTPGKQACAAVGQCELMNLYDNLFADYSITVAQMLLTRYILLEDRRKNVENALERLLSMGAVPVVNENDTVAIDELELEVGENDSLAAVVATIAKADLLIIMSDIDGLYDCDPHKSSEARLIPVVHEIDEGIRELAGGAGSKFGTGGMRTKIHAVELAYEAGIDVVLMNGRKPKRLYDLFEDKKVGTLFTLDQTISIDVGNCE
ncbi:MAG: glutamate 5-kinase [Lachnospiraceae bacterium]|nr:glutamate 5-kinase [Lachnospiraceae bacterium]